MAEITVVLVCSVQFLQLVVVQDRLGQETDPVADLGVEQILNLAHLVGQGLRTKAMVAVMVGDIRVIIISLVVEVAQEAQEALVEREIILEMAELV
jgi:hypothetical protein